MWHACIPYMHTLLYDGSGCGDGNSDVNTLKASVFTTVVVLLVRVWATSCCAVRQCCLCLCHWRSFSRSLVSPSRRCLPTLQITSSTRGSRTASHPEPLHGFPSSTPWVAIDGSPTPIANSRPSSHLCWRVEHFQPRSVPRARSMIHYPHPLPLLPRRLARIGRRETRYPTTSMPSFHPLLVTHLKLLLLNEHRIHPLGETTSCQEQGLNLSLTSVYLDALLFLDLPPTRETEVLLLSVMIRCRHPLFVIWLTVATSFFPLSPNCCSNIHRSHMVSHRN